MSSVVHHKIQIRIDAPARRPGPLPMRIATTATRAVASNAAPFMLVAIVLGTLMLAVVAAVAGA